MHYLFFHVGFHSGAKRAPCIGEALLDGREREPELLGKLRSGVAPHVVQDDRLALGGGERAQGRRHLQTQVDLRSGIEALLLREWRCGVPGASANPSDRAAQNHLKPARERLGCSQTGKRDIRFDKRLLGSILGLLDMTKRTERGGEGHVLVPLYQ